MNPCLCSGPVPGWSQHEDGCPAVSRRRWTDPDDGPDSIRNHHVPTDPWADQVTA